MYRILNDLPIPQLGVVTADDTPHSTAIQLARLMFERVPEETLDAFFEIIAKKAREMLSPEPPPLHPRFPSNFSSGDELIDAFEDQLLSAIANQHELDLLIDEALHEVPEEDPFKGIWDDEPRETYFGPEEDY